MSGNGFVLLLATTTALRGLGAGMIVGVSLMTLPVRHRLGTRAYATFIRAHYQETGVRAYAATTVVGGVLTAVALITSLVGEPSTVSWLVLVSLVTTVLGFVGTAAALPAVRRLWATTDVDEALVAMLLDRFARWSSFSAVWHVLAFLALVAAMAAHADRRNI